MKAKGPVDRGGTPPVRLTAFDWTSFVTDNFVTLVLASTMISAVGVLVVDPTKVAGGLLFYVPLSLACSFLVFVRAWKSVREEHETATSWRDAVGGTASKGMGSLNVKDARLEVFYVFALMFLPFSVVSFHSFALCPSTLRRLRANRQVEGFTELPAVPAR